MTTDPRSPDLIAHGATYTPANVVPGQAYWRLIEAQGPLSLGGRHHIYVDVLGEAGQRLIDIPVLFFWNDGDKTEHTEAKPGDFGAANFPIYENGNAYGCRVDSGLPSDELFGMGLVANHHLSYRLIFKRTLAGGDAPPQEPPPPPEPPAGEVTLEEALDQAQRWIEIARGLV